MRKTVTALAVLLAAGLLLQLLSTPVEADGRKRWSYLEALEYFRTGGVLSQGMWEALQENPPDQQSITNLRLAHEVCRMRTPEPPRAGFIQLLPTVRREVVLGGQSFAVSDQFSDVVIYAYDSPVIIHCRADSKDAAISQQLEAGGVLRVRGSGIRIENPAERRTATLTIETLRSR